MSAKVIIRPAVTSDSVSVSDLACRSKAQWACPAAYMRFIYPIVLALLLCNQLQAATYKPFPEAQVTAEQWHEYFDIIVAEFGDTRDEISEARLVVFTDEASSTFYAFTLEDHPAHPAWITRRLVEQDGAITIQQIGFFAGEEQAFADLFDDYLALSDQLKSNIAEPDNSTNEMEITD